MSEACCHSFFTFISGDVTSFLTYPKKNLGILRFSFDFPALQVSSPRHLQGNLKRSSSWTLLTPTQPVFLQCRDGQSSLANAQKLIRRVPGVSVHQADELCDMLMKAGQTFNVAVKRAVEDWAEQKLQGNELKKTLSNWGRDDGGQGTDRDEELQAAHGSTFDLRCQLQTQKERFENIQFETQCIVNEFEALRSLDEHDEAFRQGVMAVYKVCRRPPRLPPRFRYSHLPKTGINIPFRTPG